MNLDAAPHQMPADTQTPKHDGPANRVCNGAQIPALAIMGFPVQSEAGLKSDWFGT